MNNSLAGKKILVTCEKGLAEAFEKKLKKSDAEVFVLPAIEIKPVDDWKEVDEYILDLQNYDWLIFTSQNVVKYFFQRMAKSRAGKDWNKNFKIAAVGESTKNLIEKNNCKVSFLPEKFTAMDLARSLNDVSEKKILFPHGDRINAKAIHELKRRGAQVDEVILYKNIEADLSKRSIGLLNKNFDFITFMSPSAVKNVKKFIVKSNAKLGYSFIVTIGPQTERIARNEFQNVISAELHTMDGMIKKMLEYDLSTAKIAR
jgi:uroporphyrinogen-III synthase